LNLVTFSSGNIGRQQGEWQIGELNKDLEQQSCLPSTVLAGAAASPSPKEASADSQVKGRVSSCSDAHLVAECLRGSEQAWSALIDKYKRLIYSIPIKYGATRTDAADIFQSICLELFSGLRNLRKTESLKAWIIAITSRRCLHWKRQRRLETNLIGVEEEGPDASTLPAPELLEEVDKEQCLREAIAQLPPRCREMIQLLFYEQPPLPYADVARRLGLATGPIVFIRGRCLERLQENLRQAGF
jgi:RNA polymerase sigma factor (sigma-70 family)